MSSTVSKHLTPFFDNYCCGVAFTAVRSKVEKNQLAVILG
jgi:hypothetical protein